MIIWSEKPLPPINLYNYHTVQVTKYEKKVKDKTVTHRAFIDIIPLHKAIANSR